MDRELFLWFCGRWGAWPVSAGQLPCQVDIRTQRGPGAGTAAAGWLDHQTAVYAMAT